MPEIIEFDRSSISQETTPSPFDRLPDEIVLKILEYVDEDYRLYTDNGSGDQAIWFPSSFFLNTLTCCKRFTELGQDLARMQIYRSFGRNITPFIDKLNGNNCTTSAIEIWRRARIIKDGVKRKLPQSLLWTTILIILRKTYLFITHDNVDINTQEEIWSIERGEGVSLRRGPWRILPTHSILNPWGSTLHAANVTFLRLQMSSVLLPGRYKIYLNISFESHYRLANLRFTVNESEGVSAKFRSFPPLGLNFNNGLYDAKLQSEESYIASTEICIGVVEVTGESATPVTLNIEDVSVSMKRNIGFWFIYYEWFDITGGNLPAMATPFNLTDWDYSISDEGWVFPKRISMWPDRAVAVVQNNLNNLKQSMLLKT